MHVYTQVQAFGVSIKQPVRPYEQGTLFFSVVSVFETGSLLAVLELTL